MIGWPRTGSSKPSPSPPRPDEDMPLFAASAPARNPHPPPPPGIDDVETGGLEGFLRGDLVVQQVLLDGIVEGTHTELLARLQHVGKLVALALADHVGSRRGADQDLEGGDAPVVVDALEERLGHHALEGLGEGAAHLISRDDDGWRSVELYRSPALLHAVAIGSLDPTPGRDVLVAGFARKAVVLVPHYGTTEDLFDVVRVLTEKLK